MDASIRQQVVEALRKNGHKDLSRAFQVVAKSLDGVLDQLVEMAAESAEIENYRDAKATPEVKREAAKFERDCEKALEAWVKKHPLAEGYDADDLMDADGPFLVLMTLRGEGVGIWDGDWDEFFNDERKEIKALTKFLESKLGKYSDGTGGGSLEQLFEEAAFKTAAPERYEEEFASVRAKTVKANPYSPKKPTSRQEVISILVKANQPELANIVAGLTTAASGWEDKAMAELAEEQGWDLEDVEWETSRHGYGNPILIEYGREEWYVYEDHDDAEAAAIESVKNLIDEMGIEGFNKSFVMNYISVRPGDLRIIASEEADHFMESFEDDIMREDYDRLMDYVDMDRQWDKLVSTKEALEEKADPSEQIEHFEQEIRDAEEDISVQDGNAAKLGRQIQKFKKAIDKAQKNADRASKAITNVEKAMEKMIDDAKDEAHDIYEKEVVQELKDDPVGWAEERGYDMSREIPSWLMVDEDALAQAVIDSDGVGMQLASYDHNEVELDSGACAFRHN